MSRFYGEVEGSRGPAHRLGHSSITAKAQGWNLGVQVVGQVNAAGRDTFQIYANGGSNGHSSPVLLMTVTEDEAEGFVTL